MKKEIYEELKNEWKIFDMSETDIKEAYLTVTGEEMSEDETILDLKEYLIEFILENLIDDHVIKVDDCADLFNEILELWK